MGRETPSKLDFWANRPDIEAIVFFFLFLLLIPRLTFPAESSCRPLKINLFGFHNGVGLETDRKVLQETLQRFGHSVEYINYGENRKRAADINIFFEHPLENKFSWATLNWLIPNPEWYTQDVKLLDEMDLILCRTKEVQRVFSERHCPTYYLGFTSPDCYESSIQKDFSLFFHLAGGSNQKGTSAILEVWSSHRQYPHLTVIKHGSDWIVSQRNLKYISNYLSQIQLCQLQNRCGIHLCLSETEGFGHYIMEALSVGSVVITTDAPPMNEFIHDRRCLVPFMKFSRQYLATNYYVDPQELEKKINELIALSKDELREIGKQNRKIYLQKTQEFYERLDRLLLKSASHLHIKSDCAK